MRLIVCQTGVHGAAADLTIPAGLELLRVGSAGDLSDVVELPFGEDASRFLRAQPRAALRIAVERAGPDIALVTTSPAASVAAAIRFGHQRVPGTPDPVVLAQLATGSWICDVSGAPLVAPAFPFAVALVRALTGRAVSAALLDPGILSDPQWASLDAGIDRLTPDAVADPAPDLLFAAGPVGRTWYELRTPAPERIGVVVGVGIPVVVCGGPVTTAAVELASRLIDIDWAQQVRDLAASEVARRRIAGGGLPSRYDRSERTSGTAGAGRPAT